MTQGPQARLQDESLRQRVDPAGFHCLLERLPQQARDAWALGRQTALPDIEPPRRVIIAGLGGSAIGADVVATLASGLTSTPVTVVRNYHLPPLAEGTLAILSSFSGNTEETLAAFQQVADSPATGIAITTGGLLGQQASERGMTAITYAWDGPPRTGLGYGVFTPLAILRRLGVLDVSDAEVEAGIAALDRANEQNGLSVADSPAKSLATWLARGVPAVVGADMLEVAARRWAGELSENSKQVAAAYGIPEFNHNQLEAAARTDGDGQPLRFVLLDAPVVHARNRLRVQQTADMLQTAGRPVRIAEVEGDSPIEAILASCALGSWTSYYLALLREVDPSTMTVMDRLKRVLAEER